MRRILENIFFILSLVLMFFGLIDFFSLSGALLFSSSFCLVVVSFLFGFKRIDYRFLIVSFFGLAYIIFYFIWFNVSLTVVNNFLIMPLAFYLFAYSRADDKKMVVLFLLTFIAGYLTKGAMAIFSSIFYQGFHFTNFLTTINWFGSSEYQYMSRNGLSLFLLPVIASAFFYLTNFSIKKNVPEIAILGVFVFFSLFASIKVGNRAIVLVFAILVVVALLKIKTILKTKKQYIAFNVVTVSLCVIAIYLFLAYLGFIPIPAFLKNIYGIERLLSSGSNSERVSLYLSFFANFYKHPFGGMYNSLGRYIHNFYLDIYNFSGLIPFAIFSYLFVCFFLDAKKIIRHRDDSLKKVTLWIVWIIFAFTMLGMMEPIFHTDNVIMSFFAFAFAFAKNNAGEHLCSNSKKEKFPRVSSTEVRI